MISATEAQLQNITAKSDKLEALMTTRIEDVRRLKRGHDTAEEEVTQLRARLRDAEGRFAHAQRELDESTASLKLVADEYNRAQLLKKKYHNHLSELKGGPRVVVNIRDPAEHDGAAPHARQTRHDWGAVCVADPCTVNVPSKSKSFVFDGVITPDDARSPSDLFAAVNGPCIVADVLGGYNCCLFTFGQRGAGKTESLLGAPEGDAARAPAPGLVDVFIQQIFGAMEQNDVDCFTAKAQMLELKNDAIVDLFSDPTARPPGEGSGPAQYDIVRDEKGRVHVPGLQQVSVTSAQQLSQLFRWGLQSRERGASQIAGGRCHLSFSIALENYSRKGNFRRARLTFVDVAGASSAEDSGWINRSLASLGDVISALSTANQRHRQQGPPQGFDPAVGELYQRNKLTMLLSEALGGNCKTTMLCCVMPSHGLMEQLLTSLIYAYHLKCIQNPVTPFDIPADLQKLDQQIRSLDLDMGA